MVDQGYKIHNLRKIIKIVIKVGKMKNKNVRNVNK